MIAKIIMFALSSLVLRGQRNALHSRDSLVDQITTTVRHEISEMGFKLLIGVVLASTIIFSIVQLGNGVHTYTMALENGLAIMLVIFGTLLVTCSGLLYFIFHRESKKSVPAAISEDTLSPEPAGDFPDLAGRFAKGFMEGLKKGKDH